MRRSKKIWNFYLWFLKKMSIVHVRLDYLLVNYYDVPVDSTKDKVSVSGSISQGKDFFIDFLESFLIDDSVGTLLLKGSVEGTYFSCNELKWATVEQIHLGYNNVLKLKKCFWTKRGTFLKICIFTPKNCFLSIFLLTAKWKWLPLSNLSYVVIYLVNWRKVASKKPFPFCS